MTVMTIKPALTRDEAMSLACEEGRRCLDLFETLTPEQWLVSTECEPWTVRDMATHVLGNHEGVALLREGLRQQLSARRRGGNLVDALAEVQVADRAELTSGELMDRLRAAWEGSMRARMRKPVLLRRMRVRVPMRAGDERWSIAYLDDVIYTRDAWMHRMDICRALGLAPHLSAGHDGVIVAGIVQEWADRHGRPFHLSLAGSAGGVFSGALGGEAFDLDAVDFCRYVSGRGDPTGLLAVEVGY